MAMSKISDAAEEGKPNVSKTLIDTLNRSYRSVQRNGISNSRAGKQAEKQRVCHVTEFCLLLNVITEDQAQEIFLWLSKWPIHPGEFEWNVDWKHIKAERLTCLTCLGNGSFSYLNEYCHYCGGTGYQNRAKRGYDKRND